MAAKPVFQTVDPATGRKGRAYDGHTADEAATILGQVHAAFPAWRDTPFAERARLMKAAAAILRRRKDEFAALMIAEMGKTLSDGRAEIEKCAANCDFFAENAERFLADEPLPFAGGEAFIAYNPLGVILAVMPWNFPFWQVFRFAAPTLMAGNTAILKHASNVPGSALAIEEVFREAGFPADVFRTLLIGSGEVKPLIEDDRVAAVTLTGSVAAGRSVAAAAGGALKKVVLELGGSDPYIVLSDADIDEAAGVAAAARMVNGGQSCIAGKRFVVLKDVAEAFEKALVEKMSAYVAADPTTEAAKFGPMQSIKARDDIHDQVVRSVQSGARLVLGGEVPDRPGAWYPATVLADVKPGQAAYDEEVFGPVAAIIVAQDEEDAIRIANDTEFGLGSGVLTRDLERGREIAARRINAGMSFVNQNVRSDPALPFGGVKHAGHGRECSHLGIREFMNTKTVMVAKAKSAPSATE